MHITKLFHQTIATYSIRKHRHTHGTHVQLPPFKQMGMILASSDDNMMQQAFLFIDESEDDSRIDRVLCRILGQDKRTLILRLIRKRNVRVNGKRVKPDFRVHTGDKVYLPASLRVENQEPQPAKQAPKPIRNLDIIYEDDDLLVINKEAGLVVHGGSGHEAGLIERLKVQFDLPELRLAHRLDRDTSGCLLLAKNLVTLRKLTEQFRERDAHKTYFAWVIGHPYPYAGRLQSKLMKGITQSGERMVVDAEDGQEAITDLQTMLLDEHKQQTFSLVALQPHHGRTHQLRVQLQQEGHAILGDPKYAEKDDLKFYKSIGGKGLALHAWRLRFTHPRTGKEVDFRAPWPKRWAHFNQNQ